MRRHPLAVAREKKSCRVVEQDADAVIAQLVPEAVFVAVVDPFANPVDRHSGRIFSIVYNVEKNTQSLLQR